ncbi:MAG: hypothetical protein QXO80_03615 [Thermosphaera sp.]
MRIGFNPAQSSSLRHETIFYTVVRLRALDRGELREAWNQFVNRYVGECRNWRLLSVMIDSVGEQGEIIALLDESYGLWGHIWHEHDLVLDFSFALKRRIEDTGARLHLHIAYKLKPQSFIHLQGFSKNLSRAVKTLRRSLHLGGKWHPELDPIVVGEEPPSHTA